MIFLLRHTNFRSCLGILLILLLCPLGSRAQTARVPPKQLTLADAVRFAQENYPAVRAALERVAAARAGVGLARTSYLPRADMLWQENRATHNNLAGMLLPQSVVPSPTGPVLATTSESGVWGSAAGILLSWEPLDFGYRRANVNAARAAQNVSNAEVGITRLDVAVSAARAFLLVVAAQQNVEAARADVARREVLSKSVHVLAANELRPGVDASRADAELAAARTREIQAETAEVQARATLSVLLGTPGADFEIERGSLLSAAAATPLPAASVESHPLAQTEKARIDAERARLRALDRAYVPRFNLQSLVGGRGSGADFAGNALGGTAGLGLQRANWAAGVSVTFSLFDAASIRSRKQIEEANERAEEARFDQTVQDLTGQVQKARAALDGARRIAENTPLQLHAARDTETQARARYDAGLATLVEVADAQRLLVEAEVQDSLAHLDVWGGLLAVCAAQGNLDPFMQLVSGKTQGGP